MKAFATSSDFSILSKIGNNGFFATFLSAYLLMKESSGRQDYRPFLMLHPLLHVFKGALGNGARIFCPKVIIMHGYSHAPQVTDIAGHIISRGEVNELYPCVLAVCQYKIVFHNAFSFNGVGSVGGGFHRHALKILSFWR